VPDVVHPEDIEGAYVSGKKGEKALRAVAQSLSVTIDRHMFFP